MFEEHFRELLKTKIITTEADLSRTYELLFSSFYVRLFVRKEYKEGERRIQTVELFGDLSCKERRG